VLASPQVVASCTANTFTIFASASFVHIGFLLSLLTPRFPCWLVSYRGRPGLPLGLLLEELQPGKQCKRLLKVCSLHWRANFSGVSFLTQSCWFDSSVSRPPPDLLMLFLPPLSLCLPSLCLSFPAQPVDQQKWVWGGRGPIATGGVSGPDLPGVRPALSPAGCLGLALGHHAAAVSLQLGWASQVGTRTQKHSMKTC
jgi:hypothetical protein